MGPGKGTGGMGLRADEGGPIRIGGAKADPMNVRQPGTGFPPELLAILLQLAMGAQNGGAGGGGGADLLKGLFGGGMSQPYESSNVPIINTGEGRPPAAAPPEPAPTPNDPSAMGVGGQGGPFTDWLRKRGVGPTPV